MSNICYDFAKERIKKGYIGGLSEEDLKRFHLHQLIIPANDYQLANKNYPTCRLDIVSETLDGKRNFVGTNLVKYYSRGDEQFDYCLTDFEWNDSTFIFYEQAIHRLFDKMYCLKSHYVPKMPKDWLDVPYEFTYTYGDIVDLSHEDLENSPDIHCCPWHQILVMPVKFEVKKIEEV